MNWVSIVSNTGLSPVRRQAIIWTNARLLSIGLLGTNCNGIWIKIQLSSLYMHLKMTSAKWHPFCSGRDELNPEILLGNSCWFFAILITPFDKFSTSQFTVIGKYIPWSIDMSKWHIYFCLCFVCHLQWKKFSCFSIYMFTSKNVLMDWTK